MASTANKVPLFRTIAVRGYSAQAHPKAAARGSEVHTTTLPNKLTVASTETSSPVSRVSIAFRAGSRNETYESQGASHLMRAAAGLSTKNATGFGITRHLQQVGGSLAVTSDREVISYTVEVTKDNLETGLKYLEKAVTGQIFKPWEISDLLPRLKGDLGRISDEVKAVELLHRAAYRTGLGNSIFIPKYQLGKVSSETLQHFFASNFTTNRAAVAGVGVDHQVLSGFAQSLALESGEGKHADCKYHGGADARKNKGGKSASVIVAGNGGSLANIKEGMAFAVLQAAAGLGPVTKRGACNGALTRSVSSAAPKVSVSAFNALYSDNGLFGFIVSGSSKHIGKAVEAGVKALKSGSISDEDVARGKAVVKSAIAFSLETDAGTIDSLAAQSALLGSNFSLKAACEIVDALSTSDVNAAARKIASEKLTFAAVGNLDHVPYVSDFN